MADPEWDIHKSEIKRLYLSRRGRFVADDEPRRGRFLKGDEQKYQAEGDAPRLILKYPYVL
jgi:hypothetical protein